MKDKDDYKTIDMFNDKSAEQVFADEHERLHQHIRNRVEHLQWRKQTRMQRAKQFILNLIRFKTGE